NATTQTERHCLEVENGVCWSELYCLQYFDAVCCTIIDRIHNLFLGTVRRMIEKWLADEVIDNKNLLPCKRLLRKWCCCRIILY
ncbi:hypothetical protein PHYBLDRAFT_113903, partial [Phycomyces blakesleeanus NRRL 1555(-)]